MSEWMDDCGQEKEYGCFFCKTGGEEFAAREIERLLPMTEALVPMKLRFRRINGKPAEEKVALFPGYVFARMTPDTQLYDLLRRRVILRVLTDSEGDWRLRGNDRVFAEGLFRSGGVLGFSKAFYVDERIRVVDGPLASYNGQILRVNKRKKTAEIQMRFQGISMNVWLGFELIEPDEA